MAFWSLALREPKYLVMGAILWLVAAFIELLGVLARLWLDPDELDADRREHAQRAILEAETREQIARDEGALRAVRQARAQSEADAFFEALEFKREASERVSQALVEAFLRLQRERETVTAPQARESLDLQFACLQAALDRQIASLFAPAAAGAAPDPMTAPAPAIIPTAKHSAAASSPIATGRTIVL